MNIYVACPWVDREQAETVAKRLRDAGHVITHEWWHMDDSETDQAYLRRCAWWDYIGVTEADILLLLNTRKSEGKCVEQGIALALCIPIIAVGNLGEHSANVFHYLQAYTWVATVDEALSLLGRNVRPGAE